MYGWVLKNVYTASKRNYSITKQIKMGDTVDMEANRMNMKKFSDYIEMEPAYEDQSPNLFFPIKRDKRVH